MASLVLNNDYHHFTWMLVCGNGYEGAEDENTEEENMYDLVTQASLPCLLLVA